MNITQLPEIAHVFNFDELKVNQKQEEIDGLKEKTVDLLPFEESQIAKLIEGKREELNKIKNEYNPLDSKFKRIDLDYIAKLRIWDSNLKFYVPRFAIYNMNNRVLKMSVKHSLIHNSNRSGSSLDEYIEVDVSSDRYSSSFLKNYADMSLMTYWNYFNSRTFSDDRMERTITHKFEGFLPDDIRTIVKNVTKSSNASDTDKFNMSELYLIEESYKWESDFKTIKEPVRNLDPVIVGVRNNIAYYICSFDVTPAEKFLVSEMVG